MPYLIGTDEAGYAPNLGPLVVSASAWWVDEPIAPESLARLRAVPNMADVRVVQL